MAADTTFGVALIKASRRCSSQDAAWIVLQVVLRYIPAAVRKVEVSLELYGATMTTTTTGLQHSRTLIVQRWISRGLAEQVNRTLSGVRRSK